MNYKHNSITACFFLPEPLTKYQLQTMLERIKLLGCVPIGQPIYNEENWTEQELYWGLFDVKWAARFRQVYFRNASCTTFAFDLDSNFFLPGANTLYSPNGDPKFLHYKNLLSQLIMGLKPSIGEIDYEADLICSELTPRFQDAIACWGNYFPSMWINTLDKEVKGHLLRVVDETHEVDGIGMLTFIHPLKANQAWGSQHEQLDGIIKKYFKF